MEQQKVVTVGNRAYRREDLPALKAAMAALRQAIKALEATEDRPVAVGAERLWDLHQAAVKAIREVHGDRWKILGETQLISLPARLRSFTGPLGGKVKYMRDHRVPAARYWAGGAIPHGVEYPSNARPVPMTDHSEVIRRQIIADRIANAHTRERQLIQGKGA